MSPLRTHVRNPSARLETVCGLSVAGLLLRDDVAGVTCRSCIRLAKTSPASAELELRRVQTDWLDNLGRRQRTAGMKGSR